MPAHRRAVRRDGASAREIGAARGQVISATAPFIGAATRTLTGPISITAMTTDDP